MARRAHDPAHSWQGVGPGTGADVAGVSPGPGAAVPRASPVPPQMWHGEPSPGADVDHTSLMATWRQRRSDDGDLQADAYPCGPRRASAWGPRVGRPDGASGRGACMASRMCAVRLDEPACTLCMHTCSSSERCSRAHGAGGTRCGHARTRCNTPQHVATCNGLRADPTTSRLSGRRGRTAPPVALASRALSVRSTTTGMPANAAYPIALVASSSAA